LAALELAREQSPPWIIRDVAWDDVFLNGFIGGDSTGTVLLEHLTAGSLGTGDVAILVERDMIENGLANAQVRVWSFDNQLAAYGGR